jgi:hypothetical protein
MAIKAKATQEFIPIKEIRDGFVVLKDNSLRAAVMASSINFALKSEDERAAILYEFQNFLNSLDFSVQIIVHSRKLDIKPYLAMLKELEKKQINELMKIQTQEYIEFIKYFTGNTNIMTKNFFIVIPYSPSIIQTKGSGKISGLFVRKEKKNESKNEEELFDESRTQLEQRIAIVEQGVVRSGIRVARLGTEEIIELFYKIFNPGEAERAIKLENK